jgi:hypothetical protein
MVYTNAQVLALAAATNPAVTPILTVANAPVNTVGFGFTNPTNQVIVVTLYRNSTSSVAIGTVTVPALAGITGSGVSVSLLAYNSTLNIGESIYASATVGGYVNVELDGYSTSANPTLTTNQLLQGMIMQNTEISGVDIPDQYMLQTGGYNF